MLNSLRRRNKLSKLCVSLLMSVSFLVWTLPAQATRFVHLTADNGASVNTSTNNYVEGGTNYPLIYKPSPPAAGTPKASGPPLAVQRGHPVLVVAVTRDLGGRHRRLDRGELVGREFQLEGPERLGQPRAPFGADERDDVVAA